MTAFDKAWEVVKELSDYERATAKEFASGDMKEGYIDREIRGSAGSLSSDEFHDIWADEDSCGCTTEDEEADELEAAYMAKHGITDPHEIDWMDKDVYPAGYRKSSKWMKHGPNYLPNRNSIHASCGHCGTSTIYNLDAKEFRHT
tara:strand:+ start:754 stop:1188 length:435 start_codon:yes stop_codon:yes gene_type:complete